MDDETKMWRDRAEAAEDEIRILRATRLSREQVETVEIYTHAVRLVSLAGIYSDDVVKRAMRMLGDAEVNAEDEDAAALRSVIRMLERRSNPDAWRAQMRAEW